MVQLWALTFHCGVVKTIKKSPKKAYDGINKKVVLTFTDALKKTLITNQIPPNKVARP